MSLKSKFKAFASAYKSALKNGNNDEWSEASKDVSIKDSLNTLGKGIALGVVATASFLSSKDTVGCENGYTTGNEGEGLYSNGVKIDD